MPVFHLPDLGEGLPDAEIVEWFVKEGDTVTVDQPMVSMETAKAVVDVPAPHAGVIAKLHGAAGDVIDTGAPLVTFSGTEEDAPGDESDAAAPGTAADASSQGSAAEGSAETDSPDDDQSESDEATETVEVREDSGTVVGEMQASDEVVGPTLSSVGNHRVTPAVRALARKLKVDLATVSPSGADGVITAADVKARHEAGPATAPAAPATITPREPVPAPAAKPAVAAAPAATAPTGDWAPVRGTRRTMARAMSAAHAAVVPTSITEDVDVALWEGKQDVTVRMIRALVAGCAREPVLNAWFDADGPKRLVHEDVHVGVAVDTADGLFVSTLRQANRKTPAELRQDINQLRTNVANRSIPPADLTGYTIMLSNVGVYAGQYTTPVVTPPCVAILATGKMRDQVVASHGAIAVHPVIPISLTFDHRAVTGGEAARFLKAYMEDLSLAH